MTRNDPIDLDALVDRGLVRRWLGWGMVWLLLAPTAGVLVATKFHQPEFLGSTSWLTFGRLRPVHVNGVIFGAFSTLFLGLAHWIVPRLCGIPVAVPRLGHALVWAWNGTLAAGFLSLLLGANQGIEAGEFPLAVDIAILACLLALTVQFFLTIARRRFERIYVSLWYLIAAFVWTDVNWILGSFVLPYAVPGTNNAALHGLYLHYVVGLWITPAGYVLIYYFLPVCVRSPIANHRLSLIGFWTLAFFYPFVGIHHYLYSPIADWAETLSILTSMLLIIPVWTVLQNFFGTMVGRWNTFGRNFPAKFLILGSILYLVGCFQGSVEALRSIQEPTHFTDFVIAHSHLTVFGTFVVWAIAGTLHVWPRVQEPAPDPSLPANREAASIPEPWSSREGFLAGNVSFWMVAVGIAVMGLVLSAQGLQQGFLWMAGVEWLDAMQSMRPFWIVRTLAGITIDAGTTLLVIRLVGFARRARRPAAAGGTAAR